MIRTHIGTRLAVIVTPLLLGACSMPLTAIEAGGLTPDSSALIAQLSTTLTAVSGAAGGASGTVADYEDDPLRTSDQLLGGGLLKPLAAHIDHVGVVAPSRWGESHHFLGLVVPSGKPTQTVLVDAVEGAGIVRVASLAVAAGATPPVLKDGSAHAVAVKGPERARDAYLEAVKGHASLLQAGPGGSSLGAEDASDVAAARAVAATYSVSYHPNGSVQGYALADGGYIAAFSIDRFQRWDWPAGTCVASRPGLLPSPLTPGRYRQASLTSTYFVTVQVQASGRGSLIAAAKEPTTVGAVVC